MFRTEQTAGVTRASISRFMPGGTPYTRTFRLAIETLGGCEQVANVLGASVAEVEAWAAGFTDPPPGAFLKAIDIVAQAGLRTRRSARS